MRECFRINSDVRRVYHVPLAFQSIYGRSDEGGENRDGEEGSGISRKREESGGCLDSCIQMISFCVASRRKN